MAKAVTTTIKDSFFDDPFFKASQQKMKNILPILSNSMEKSGVISW